MAFVRGAKALPCCDARTYMTPRPAHDFRPHPSIEPRMAFRDIPRLCDHLNEKLHPSEKQWTIAFGYLVFGEPVQDLKESQCHFQTEQYVVLVQPNGYYYDCAPPYSDSQHIDCTGTRVNYFIADKKISFDEYTKAMFMLDCLVQSQYLTHCTQENIDIPDGLNASWKNDEVSVVVAAITDSCLTLNRKGKEVEARLAAQRKDAVLNHGVVYITRPFLYVLKSWALNLSDHVSSFSEDLAADPDVEMFAFNPKEIAICCHCYLRCTAKEIKRCSACKNATYCSKACQTLHWRQHKHTCEAVATAARREAGKEATERMKNNALARESARQAEARRLAAASRSAREESRKAALEKAADVLAARMMRSHPGPSHHTPSRRSKIKPPLRSETDKKASIEAAQQHARDLADSETERVATLERMMNSVRIGEAIARGL